MIKGRIRGEMIMRSVQEFNCEFPMEKLDADEPSRTGYDRVLLPSRVIFSIPVGGWGAWEKSR